ncbi:hypothetical protein [Actinoplanes aureus]|jgi:hypothetical protein|uniref:Uncharacterized protein n=1 Tax=Actinoplanes aureus TaxID=2792083 RepID=A0A931C1R9_9ACTN|nr:hypothetical protein [Actinoplanes aureus]MBG0561729.1 hypothetical protein [Actinoplanes aureus]
MRKITKRSAVIAGVTAVALSGGAAWAAITGWGIEGSGEASAKAAEIKKLKATSSFTKNLYPGLATKMATTVENPNEFPVQLTGTVGVADVTVNPASNDCKTGLFAPGVITTDFPGTPTIPALTSDHAVSSDVTIGSIPQACAGKTIKVVYTFTGVSKA